MESSQKGKAGLNRLGNALRYSLQGIGAAFRHEHAFRREIVLAVVLIPVAWLIEASGIGRAVMIGSILLVLIVELLSFGDRGSGGPYLLRGSSPRKVRKGPRERRGVRQSAECRGHVDTCVEPLGPIQDPTIELDANRDAARNRCATFQRGTQVLFRAAIADSTSSANSINMSIPDASRT